LIYRPGCGGGRGETAGKEEGELPLEQLICLEDYYVIFVAELRLFKQYTVAVAVADKYQAKT